MSSASSSYAWRDRFAAAHGFYIIHTMSPYGDLWLLEYEELGRKHHRRAASPEEIALWKTLVGLNAPPTERKQLLEEFEHVG